MGLYDLLLGCYSVTLIGIGKTGQGKIEYDVEVENGLSLDGIMELAFILSPYLSKYVPSWTNGRPELKAPSLSDDDDSDITKIANGLSRFWKATKHSNK